MIYSISVVVYLTAAAAVVVVAVVVIIGLIHCHHKTGKLRVR